MDNLKKIANDLNSLEVGTPEFDAVIEKAKELNIIIAFGESDDTLTLEGHISDEFEVYGGGDLYFNSEGVFHFDFDYPYSDLEKQMLKKITAEWEPTVTAHEELKWLIKSDMPNKSFLLFNQDGPFCEGIAFYLPKE